ncbi:MAG: hypothetical protein QOH62_1639 [Solirubrobacteraceae bacterium]|nr:hypothetical protein [Solirubrobacteraceae bacterium]
MDDSGQAAAESRQRYGLLLIALLVTLLVQGMLPAGEVQQIVVTTLVGGTLVLALRASDVRLRFVHVAEVGAVIAVTATLVEAALGQVDALSTSIANAVLVSVAPPAVALGVLRNLRRHERIPVQAVMGVLCLYLLFGMFFAFVYGALNRIDEPFFVQSAVASASNCQYFSFTTLTTVGFGDLTARTPVGHTLAVLEALVGQIYLVTIVSLIVSNVGRERGRRS